MSSKPFRKAVEAAAAEGRRLVVPLMGFPGLQLTGCSIKLAQQNFGEHFKVVRALAERFRPDTIFPLMDLSVEANALGRFTHFPKAESATVVQDTFAMEELERAGEINITFDTRLTGYVETVKMMSVGLPAGMLRGAYVTGPYSLAALIMGADEAAMATMLRPDDLHAVCRFCTERIQEYVRLLLCAGAQIICILEPSAVMLGPDQFEEFSGNYVRHINESCKYTDVATVYHTCGNTMHLAGKMAAAGVDAISLDSPESGVDLPAITAVLPPEGVVVGNISPTGALLTGTPAEVEAEVDDLLERMAPYPNFILSTGCDLPQETPLENIAAFMSAGRRYRLP
jgi:uroporphyrinogen decarboxylase